MSEVYIDQSLVQVCAELEAQQSRGDQQFMLDELDDDDIETSDQRQTDDDDNPLAGYYCPACGEALEEGHACAELDILAQSAWSSYKSGICPCGNAECDGIEWLLSGNEPFEMLEVDL